MAANYHHVSHDIVESILSRLPVKSLLRFKGVCKQWSATISDDRKFAETYLERSNTYSSSSLQFLSLRLGFRRIQSLCGEFCFRRIQFENNEFRKLPIEKYTVQGCCGLLGSCNGIFLLSLEDSTEDYVVWNPSTRTHREVRCPYPIDGNRLIKSGICYDPLMKDYKVVIGDAKHYAVYYCKTKSWSELKEMKPTIVISVVIIDYYRTAMGVHFKGSLYWISGSKDGPRFEIDCFDGRDEEFKNYGSVDSIYSRTQLTSSRDCLYFIAMGFLHDTNTFKQIVVMKKVGHDDPWMELKLKLPFPCVWVKPLCLMIRENQIMLTAYDQVGKLKYFIYVDTKRSYATLIQSAALDTYPDLFPNLENLRLL